MYAASGYSCDDKLISGFGQSLSNKISIGVGITEGYTDLIFQRYFCEEILEKIGYRYHKIVSKLTEFIIGKEKMQDLYF